LRIEAGAASWVGVVLLVLAFMVFFFYGNVAPGIVILALGVILVVNGARTRRGSAARTETVAN
jgi:membrane-bound ClpP family serine protease